MHRDYSKCTLKNAWHFSFLTTRYAFAHCQSMKPVHAAVFLLMIMSSGVSNALENKDVQLSLAERAWPRARNFIAGMASGVGLVLAGSSESFNCVFFRTWHHMSFGVVNAMTCECLVS